MTSPDTLNETIAMLRRRMLEIDRLIERFERERTLPREAPKKVRCSHDRPAARKT